MWLVADESMDVIKEAVRVFQSYNPAWPLTKVIFSDKDFTERQSFSSLFPQASLKICLFHVLKAIRREVTIDKMGITPSQREACLKLFTELVYARGHTQYEQAREKLHNTKLTSVVSYFEKNWHSIKDEWVQGFITQSLTLGETTNNRLESINAKIKSVCTRIATLDQFFNEFFSVLATLHNERNYNAVMSSIKHPTILPSEDYLQKYQEVLTPYAYQMLLRQHSALHTVKLKSCTHNEFTFQSSAGEAVTTDISCSCCFANATCLPCKHIITVRRKQELDPFDKNLVTARWSKESYKAHIKLRFQDNSNLSTSTTVNKINQKQKPRILNHFEKFNLAKKLGLQIASAMSYSSHEKFQADMEVLQDFLKRLQDDLPLLPICSKKYL